MYASQWRAVKYYTHILIICRWVSRIVIIYEWQRLLGGCWWFWAYPAFQASPAAGTGLEAVPSVPTAETPTRTLQAGWCWEIQKVNVKLGASRTSQNTSKYRIQEVRLSWGEISQIFLCSLKVEPITSVYGWIWDVEMRWWDDMLWIRLLQRQLKREVVHEMCAVLKAVLVDDVIEKSWHQKFTRLWYWFQWVLLHSYEVIMRC